MTARNIHVDDATVTPPTRAGLCGSKHIPDPVIARKKAPRSSDRVAKNSAAKDVGATVRF
jgi:hypothetical protein